MAFLRGFGIETQCHENTEDQEEVTTKGPQGVPGRAWHLCESVTRMRESERGDGGSISRIRKSKSRAVGRGGCQNCRLSVHSVITSTFLKRNGLKLLRARCFQTIDPGTKGFSHSILTSKMWAFVSARPWHCVGRTRFSLYYLSKVSFSFSFEHPYPVERLTSLKPPFSRAHAYWLLPKSRSVKLPFTEPSSLGNIPLKFVSFHSSWISCFIKIIAVLSCHCSLSFLCSALEWLFKEEVMC